MNATIVIPQEVVDEQLAKCADGETADFTLTGATFTLVPGVGAVISGDTITKDGEMETEDETSAEPGEDEMPMKGMMSPSAKAVVGRKALAAY